MQPSSILCRAQEAAQRSRAADTTLDNVRRQATKAADAWAKEAIDAENRENRLARSRVVAEEAADRRAALGITGDEAENDDDIDDGSDFPNADAMED